MWKVAVVARRRDGYQLPDPSAQRKLRRDGTSTSWAHVMLARVLSFSVPKAVLRPFCRLDRVLLCRHNTAVVKKSHWHTVLIL